MRVTTQMMHTSAKRAGISLEGTSLLNYINGNNAQSSQNALLNALSKTQSSTGTKIQHDAYEKLETSAETLVENMEAFLVEGEECLFQTDGENKADVYDAVKQMLNSYNNVVKELKNTSNPLNDFYKEMLGEAVTENKEVLAAIGITQKDTGMLTLDKEKFENADMESIKNALDGNGTFSVKTAYIAGRIYDNAKANMESYSSQYGANGYSYYMNTSKYDFWG